MILVTVGTDHHPFDRLVRWIEQWPARSMADVVVQHGTVRPIASAECHAFLDPTHMSDLLGKADVVVCAAGPGTVMSARRAGIRPLVVPRTAALGEHVDDHQQSFARHLSGEGVATVVEQATALYTELDRLFLDFDAHRVQADPTGPIGVNRVGPMIDELVRGRR
jgi:UDP-N-acetylglucosamine transferase subunit ALG13